MRTIKAAMASNIGMRASTVSIHPIEWAMTAGVHPVYNFRNRRITKLANNCHMVDATLKDDSPGFETRDNCDMHVRFYIYNDRPDLDWSWLKTELFYYIEHLVKKPQ